MSVGVDRRRKYEICSKESIEKVYVDFVNTTTRMVDVLWIDYDGIGVPYITLDPGGHLLLFTYKTHPWIFRDHFTGERFHVANNDVYWPVPYETAQIAELNNVIIRKEVLIHFPMRTLKENAIWEVIKQVRDRYHIDEFPIPLTLKHQLKYTFINSLRR